MQTIEEQIDLAADIAAEQCCNNSDPVYGRDPVLLSTIAKDCSHGDGLVQCKRGRPRDTRQTDNTHVWRPLRASVLEDALASFFKPCRSSRKIENRSSAAPKAKTVRFADTMVSEYRCIPSCRDSVAFRKWGATAVSWTPSKKELEGFRAYDEMF
jgi:hypothetical protein